MNRLSFLAFVVIAVVCLSFVFVALFFVLTDTSNGGTVVSDEVFSEDDFPLEVDLEKTFFNVGEKISGTASITNKCGKDVTIYSNGDQPILYFCKVDCMDNHGGNAVGVFQTLNVGDKLSRDFMYEAVESGAYILNVHYWLQINGYILCTELIVDIEVK